MSSGDHLVSSSPPCSGVRREGGSGTKLDTPLHSDSLPSPPLLRLLVFETLSCPFPVAQLPDRKSD